MRKMMILGGLLAAATVAFAYNDLAPHDNTAETSFWVTKAHPEVVTSTAVSSGVGGLGADDEIDTRTFSEVISNILTRFRTTVWTGFAILFK